MKTINEVKATAFRIPDTGIITYFPQWNSEETIFPPFGKRSVYNFNNGICAFIDENGTEYVIPFFQGLHDILRNGGYKEAGIYVPFSNWDYPKHYADQWRHIKNKVS